ncbi:17302_t:CDS:2 [Entrophospora sp. SA101]|nr:17302_t:CDS:2 [Entrophospora sp. SA101]
MLRTGAFRVTSTTIYRSIMHSISPPRFKTSEQLANYLHKKTNMPKDLCLEYAMFTEGGYKRIGIQETLEKLVKQREKEIVRYANGNGISVGIIPTGGIFFVYGAAGNSVDGQLVMCDAGYKVGNHFTGVNVCLSEIDKDKIVLRKVASGLRTNTISFSTLDLPIYLEKSRKDNNSSPRELFFRAVEENDIKAIEELIKEKQVEVSACDDFGNSALHYALLEANIKVIDKLLELGAKVNIINKGGFSPLHIAVTKSKENPEYREIAKKLLVNGANPNLSKNGDTPLHNAATQGDLESLKLLQESIVIDTDSKNISAVRNLFLQKDSSYAQRYDNFVKEIYLERLKLKEQKTEKEQQLENILSRIKDINRKVIQILQDNYKQLILAQQNNDQTKIKISQDKIEKIKQNFLKDKIPLESLRINRVQEICQLCEEIVKLSLQQQVDEQVEAQIQIPSK